MYGRWRKRLEAGSSESRSDARVSSKLSRTASLADEDSRWTGSKQDMVVHYPPLGLIESISLSYPTYSPPPPRSLVVGKSQPASSSSSAPAPSNEANTPTKMTHRQKYEALIAATTRPAPYVLSASLFMGSIVRSDPLSGKTSKGFWGPGRGGESTSAMSTTLISSQCTSTTTARSIRHSICNLPISTITDSRTLGTYGWFMRPLYSRYQVAVQPRRSSGVHQRHIRFQGLSRRRNLRYLDGR